MVASGTVSIEIGNTSNIGNVDLVNKVLDFKLFHEIFVYFIKLFFSFI